MQNRYFFYGLLIGITLPIIFVVYQFVFAANVQTINLTDDSYKDLNGKSVSLLDLNKKPLVLNYWATWCEPCVKEFKDFERFQNKYGNFFNIVMISDESTAKIKNFKDKNQYNFIFLKSTKKLELLGISIRPSTFFINKKGEVIVNNLGSLNFEKIVVNSNKLK